MGKEMNRKSKWTNGQKDKLMDKRTSIWTKGQDDGQKDRMMDKRTKSLGDAAI
jgi:hypothetical protein